LGRTAAAKARRSAGAGQTRQTRARATTPRNAKPATGEPAPETRGLGGIIGSLGGYLCDALDWMNPYWHGDMDDSRELDDSFATQQDRHFPQP
jgi:hypothetical protein